MNKVYVNKKLLLVAIISLIILYLFFRLSEDTAINQFGFSKDEIRYINEQNQVLEIDITPHYNYENHLEVLQNKILEETGLNIRFNPSSDASNAFYTFKKAQYMLGDQTVVYNYQGDYLHDVQGFYVSDTDTDSILKSSADNILSDILSKVFDFYETTGQFEIWKDERNFSTLQNMPLDLPPYDDLKVGIINVPPVSYVSNQNIFGSSMILLNQYGELYGVTLEYTIGEKDKLLDLLNEGKLDLLLTDVPTLDVFTDHLIYVSQDAKLGIAPDVIAIQDISYNELASYIDRPLLMPGKMYEFLQEKTNTDLHINAISDQTISYGFDGDPIVLNHLSYHLKFVNAQRLQNLGYFYLPNDKQNQTTLIVVSVVLAVLLFITLVVLIVRLVMSIQEKRRLNYLFKHDQLTYLLNHNGMKKVFSKVKENNGLMMLIDLRHFKLLNDVYGTDVGDLILIKLSQAFSAIDDSLVVARTRGDQFMFLTVSDASEQYLQDILDVFSNFKSEQDNAEDLDISACYVSFPRDGDTFDTLNQHLESAMYYAKSINKINAWIEFNNEIYNSYLEEQQLSLEIQKALEHEDFSLFYQPQTELTTETTIGAEVLIRWHHKERGPIYPDQFLGVAERNGLMRELDMYMIAKACQQIKWWQENNYNKMKISVNMSTYTFESLGMSEQLIEIVSTSGIDTSWFAIEITEESGFKNIKKANQVMTEIKSYGIRFALDDFGKGYSSISYLESLPFDFLKIDKAFVDHIHTSEKSKTLYYLITDLAKLYDMHIIAEGVEYVEQINVIKKDIDTIIQGYYYSKPLPLEDFDERVSNQ